MCASDVQHPPPAMLRATRAPARTRSTLTGAHDEVQGQTDHGRRARLEAARALAPGIRETAIDDDLRGAMKGIGSEAPSRPSRNEAPRRGKSGWPHEPPDVALR